MLWTTGEIYKSKHSLLTFIQLYFNTFSIIYEERGANKRHDLVKKLAEYTLNFFFENPR